MLKTNKNLAYNKITIFLLYAMLFPLAFDYRTADGGSKFLIIMFSLISLASSIFLLIKIKKVYKYSIYFIITIILFIITSTISGILNNQKIYNIFSSEIPLLLFLFSFIIFSSIDLYKNSLYKIISILLGFMFLSILFKVFFGFYYYGLTLSNVRYQIVSPVLILLFSYGLTTFIYKKNKWGLAALSISIIVAFLAVTRTYLLAFIIVSSFWIIILPLKYWLKNLKRIFQILFLLLSLFLMLYIISPEMVERWIVRLFTGIENKGGIDVTYITRIAEATYQINKLLENIQNFFFGLGIFGKTGFPEEYRKILTIVYSDDFEFIGHGFGHNTYIGILFTSGAIVGSVFIYMLLNTIIKAITFSKNQYILIKKNKLNPIIYAEEYFFILAWGTSSTLGYLTYGLLAGIFGDRLYSLSLGISFGLIFLGRRYIVKSQK